MGCVGLLFPFLPLINTLPSPPAPVYKYDVCPPNSYSLMPSAYVRSQMPSVILSPPLTYILKAEPMVPRCALMCTLFLQFAVFFVGVCCTDPCQCVACSDFCQMLVASKNSAGQSQLAGSHPGFRNSFSVERLWSLFVDCGCRFKKKNKKQNSACESKLCSAPQ